jgi:NAD(P)-dependent dehydrogenase (short-subunit alcohol dehydrogenase family)
MSEMSNQTLVGRRALVTGAASGIGAGIARRLAAEGATVLLTDVDVAGGTEVAVEIGATFAKLDVADPDAWDRVVSLHGPFDIGVLNAGVSTRTNILAADPSPIPLADLSDADYRRALGVNLDGAVFGARALIPAMCERRFGDLVVTASLAGLVGMSIDPIYGTTKHAVVGLVRSLAPALQPFDVCISSLNPGFVDTAILGELGAEQITEMGLPLLQPSDIAEVVMRALRERTSGAQWVAWGDLPVRPYEWNAPF